MSSPRWIRRPARGALAAAQIGCRDDARIARRADDGGAHPAEHLPIDQASRAPGELLAFDLELQPDGAVPGKHVHPSQEERFTVVSGRMKFRKGLRTVIAEAGDMVVVPAGTPHRFENAGREVARVEVEVRPALKMEQLLRTAVRLAEEGRSMRSGMPKPLDLALFTREFRDEVRGAFPPAWVQQATMAPLARIAERRGRAAIYTERPATA